MKHKSVLKLHAAIAGVVLALQCATVSAAGFSSGSTGADGAFTPTANTTVNLPASGVLHYTTVDIPAGVTVRFARNAMNTAVVILATGNVNIAGAIDISGGAGQSGGVGTTGERLGGLGGPGGYDGGRGGMPESNRRGGSGLGPGAGGGGDQTAACCSSASQGGGGAGHAIAGSSNLFSTTANNTGVGGTTYGSNLMTPLVGGSGGGAGAGALLFDGVHGSGGGGGAGALLIVSSTAVTISGSILAQGGSGGATNGSGLSFAQAAGAGGGGSGGSIRVIAPVVTSTGTLNVNGGAAGVSNLQGLNNAGAGARGRVSLEQYAAGTFSLAAVPMLAITSVAGIAAPAAPTGTGDIAIPAATANPVPLVITSSGIPPGAVVVVRVTPLRGLGPTSYTSPPLAGTTASASASVDVSIPGGLSTITAQTSYTITVAMGDALRNFANNERVEKITVGATLGGPSTVTLTTVSGKAFQVPGEVLNIAALSGAFQ